MFPCYFSKLGFSQRSIILNKLQIVFIGRNFDNLLGYFKDRKSLEDCAMAKAKLGIKAEIEKAFFSHDEDVM